MRRFAARQAGQLTAPKVFAQLTLSPQSPHTGRTVPPRASGSTRCTMYNAPDFSLPDAMLR
jgi:hypothetical protein